MVKGLGFSDKCLVFTVYGLSFKVQGSGFRVLGSRCGQVEG
jgi:hypothetical protein